MKRSTTNAICLEEYAGTFDIEPGRPGYAASSGARASSSPRAIFGVRSVNPSSTGTRRISIVGGHAIASLGHDGAQAISLAE